MVIGSRAHTERHSARSARDYGVRNRGTGLLACLAWFPGPPAVCRPPPVVARVQTRCLRPGSTLRQPLTLLRVTFAQMGSTLRWDDLASQFSVGAEQFARSWDGVPLLVYSQGATHNIFHPVASADGSFPIAGAGIA